MENNIVWKSGFRVRLEKAVLYFKKNYPEKENSIEYKKAVDNFESRWHQKARTQTEKAILKRELDKLKI